MISLPVAPTHYNENLTFYTIIAPEAGQGWKLELFDLSEPIPMHYHKIRRQYILVVEGELQIHWRAGAPTLLEKGNLICIDPGTEHELVPQDRARYFFIDLPGFNYPEDIYYDAPDTLQWSPINRESMPPLGSLSFLKIDQKNYLVYELISGVQTDGKWSAALLEINDSPKHFHRIEKEHFIVVNGALDIEVDGQSQILEAGASITIGPEKVHKLKSATKSPVRVLSFNFPAFDPLDMHCVD